jgi:abnormal spindle-like microcephaly-associated protein
MLRCPEATPCPASTPTDNVFNIRAGSMRDSLNYGDTTSNIGFTAESHASLRAAGPKRRATAVRPRRPGRATEFAIHKDEGPKIMQDGSDCGKQDFPRGHKLSILAQPAQRGGSMVRSALGKNENAATKKTIMEGDLQPAKLAASTDLAAHPVPKQTMNRDFANGDGRFRKPARRGTVYIPSEDTTMPTVWMGVFSPIQNTGDVDGNYLEDRPADLAGIAAQMAKKRGPRKPTVTAAPRRTPLQRQEMPPQETMIREDIPGRLTGKENLPPVYHPRGGAKAKKDLLVDSSEEFHQVPRRPAAHLARQGRPPPHSSEIRSSSGSCSGPSTKAVGLDRPQRKHAGSVVDQTVKKNLPGLGLGRNKKVDVWNRDLDRLLNLTPELSSRDNIEEPPAKLIIPNVSQPVVEYKYPLLSEDIQNPSLYENNWLAHQEIAITQLVNNLFGDAKNSVDTSDVHTTRLQLMKIYQDQSFVFLQRRLQASLLYGSLSMPKETLAKSSRLPEDLGMKQNFLDLWLNSYELSILQACAEVVIGRCCSRTVSNLATAPFSTCSTPKKVSRQNLSRYLETFLVRNEDTCPDNGMVSSGTTGLHHTLLRSLMLIKLLDTAKASRQTSFLECLFQPSSPHKSSVAVLRTLAQMLLPSAGNIVRSLNHLDYIISHTQYPLEEYDYHIGNLAVDLRDGVRLTRLVELLLYPSASHLSHNKDENATATVTMPTGEVLSLMQGEHDWPLSQHLKFPCLSRATKLYNVQIALSALLGIRGVAKIVDDIKAENIVDGFREKTVALLWGLASKSGLGSLIDWEDLKAEVRRLGGTLADFEENEDDLARHISLFKDWASAAAARKGLPVNNLTTSFADGKVFEAIVDEYEPYLSASKIGSNSSMAAAKGNLSHRLADLGCSAQFGKHQFFIKNP